MLFVYNGTDKKEEGELYTMTGLEELRDDICREQKKGLPFIITSVVTWLLIAVVTTLNLPIETKNILVFCCSCPLMPLAFMVGKIIKVDIFSKENPLGKLGFLFTCNQFLYLLIVMWVFSAVPDKMVMVYAMVFGAHLLPYSWLYKSNGYKIFSIVLSIAALVIGNVWNATVLAFAFVAMEIVFAVILSLELRKRA